ncbi:hypothetical protein K7X08_022946 [Anisodus acutangulus]|uniref:Uncharacterized protein n=1 Tax=Anisodus acutangulus TaxID=402998 RepID=A0A9Q1RGW6_9SOLA|nr:hypothetical protein K7X08_022946 [Anisodus acutangulus]
MIFSHKIVEGISLTTSLSLICLRRSICYLALQKRDFPLRIAEFFHSPKERKSAAEIAKEAKETTTAKVSDYKDHGAEKGFNSPIMQSKRKTQQLRKQLTIRTIQQRKLEYNII